MSLKQLIMVGVFSLSSANPLWVSNSERSKEDKPAHAQSLSHADKEKVHAKAEKSVSPWETREMMPGGPKF